MDLKKLRNEEDFAVLSKLVSTTASGPTRLLSLLFQNQLDLVLSKSLRKAALCSRRAGKTYCAAVYLLHTAFKYPNSLNVYVALSRLNAKRILWNDLQNLNRLFSLGIVFNHSELIANLPNGSAIWLSGASDAADIEKFRGSKYKLVVLDECASFGAHIEQLIEEVFEPALIDLNGTMMLIGTPAAACAGKFHDVTTGIAEGWEVHKWSILDNPHIPHAKKWLDDMLHSKNWDEQNPIFMREWKGQWVRSSDSMVYLFDVHKNVYNELPQDKDFMYILGIDLGYEDATAFVIGAFTPKQPNFYVVETYKKTQMIPSDIAQKVRYYVEKYNVFKIKMDTGGLGKSLAEEFKQRYALPVEAAEKKSKFEFIELMNSDFRDGYIKLPVDSELADEYSLLQWDEDGKSEDERFENHLADAALYAWRESRHYTHVPEVPKPLYGSSEYWNNVAAELEQQEAMTLKARLEEEEDLENFA